MISVFSNIRSLYKASPSMLCVKLLIKSSIVEEIIKILLRTIEDDSNHIKVRDKLVKNDSSVFEYRNK